MRGERLLSRHLRPRPRAGPSRPEHLGRPCRNAPARPRGRRARLPAVLARGAPQHARGRRHEPTGARCDGGGGHRAHPGRLRWGDAAQPRAARRRRAVRPARGSPPRADRPRNRTGTGHRPGHRVGAASRWRRRGGRRRRALPRVRRQHHGDALTRRRRAAPVHGHSRPAGDAARDIGAQRVAAGIVGLLGSARR
jgi:hypothetical protein